MSHRSVSVEATCGAVRRRLLRPLAAAFVLAASVAGWPAAAAAQAPSDVPNPPPFYAITNARIVTVSGPVIEGGTVVIANGLIAAVGTDVTIPPEAWVIDGSGLTVYPGLFDALSDLALSPTDGPASGGRTGAAAFTGGGETSDGPEDRPSTYPSRAAADLLTTDDSRIETWREGGFTTVMTIPSDGFVTGQGAVIGLSNGEAAEMVIKTPVALRLNWRASRGRRSYPGSLFGVIAYEKQLFMDATLEPLSRVVSESWPVLIPGDEPREILRAIDLGAALGVRTVVYGARMGYDVASRLAEVGVPVLVNLDWPERTRDADPESEESLASLRERAWAP